MSSLTIVLTLWTLIGVFVSFYFGYAAKVLLKRGLIRVITISLLKSESAVRNGCAEGRLIRASNSLHA